MPEKLINCPFGYMCDEKWNDLDSTVCEKVRFCKKCKDNVYWVDNKEELNDFVNLGRCVCCDHDVLKASQRDLISKLPRGRYLGIFHPNALKSSKNKNRDFLCDSYDDKE